MRGLLLTALLLFPGCSTLSKIDEALERVQIPVAQSAQVAAALTSALPLADLNGDGYVSGLREMGELVKAFVAELANRGVIPSGRD